MNKSKKRINYSEIPATNEEFWANASIHLPKKKSAITIRLEPEVIDFFKTKGKGYQTKINAVLKSYVKAHNKSKVYPCLLIRFPYQSTRLNPLQYLYYRRKIKCLPYG